MTLDTTPAIVRFTTLHSKEDGITEYQFRVDSLLCGDYSLAIDNLSPRHRTQVENAMERRFEAFMSKLAAVCP